MAGLQVAAGRGTAAAVRHTHAPSTPYVASYAPCCAHPAGATGSCGGQAVITTAVQRMQQASHVRQAPTPSKCGVCSRRQHARILLCTASCGYLLYCYAVLAMASYTLVLVWLGPAAACRQCCELFGDQPCAWTTGGSHCWIGDGCRGAGDCSGGVMPGRLIPHRAGTTGVLQHVK